MLVSCSKYKFFIYSSSCFPCCSDSIHPSWWQWPFGFEQYKYQCIFGGGTSRLPVRLWTWVIMWVGAALHFSLDNLSKPLCRCHIGRTIYCTLSHLCWGYFKVCMELFGWQDCSPIYECKLFVPETLQWWQWTMHQTRGCWERGLCHFINQVIFPPATFVWWYEWAL